MGRRALTIEEKAAAKAFRESPAGREEKLFRNNLKNLRIVADLMKDKYADASGAIEAAANVVIRHKTLENDVKTGGTDYLEVLRDKLTRKLTSLQQEIVSVQEEIANLSPETASAEASNRVSKSAADVTAALNELDKALSPHGVTYKNIFPNM